MSAFAQKRTLASVLFGANLSRSGLETKVNPRLAF